MANDYSGAGERIKHDDDFYGRTVAIAARISALALGGEVLASDLVYALARGLGTFTFGDARAATLKGIDGSFDISWAIASALAAANSAAWRRFFSRVSSV